MDALTFQAEVRRIEKLMYRISMSYLGNVEDAADECNEVVTDSVCRKMQDTFIHIFDIEKTCKADPLVMEVALQVF